MTKPYSVAFKQKMVQRLTGKNAVSASELARETGVRQQILSRWLEDARSLPLFRTLKYTPAYPRLPFADIGSAERWVARFVTWYNGVHRHSGIRYVTPDERHYGREHGVLARRQDLYARARQANPERWTRATRNSSPVGLVVLNPERRQQQAAA